MTQVSITKYNSCYRGSREILGWGDNTKASPQRFGISAATGSCLWGAQGKEPLSRSGLSSSTRYKSWQPLPNSPKYSFGYSSKIVSESFDHTKIHCLVILNALLLNILTSPNSSVLIIKDRFCSVVKTLCTAEQIEGLLQPNRVFSKGWPGSANGSS